MSGTDIKHTGSARQWIPQDDQVWFAEEYFAKFLTDKAVVEDSGFNIKTIDRIIENKPVSPATIERIQELRKKHAA